MQYSDGECRSPWWDLPTCSVNAAWPQQQRSRKTAFLDQYIKPSKESAEMTLHCCTNHSPFAMHGAALYLSSTLLWPVDTYSLGIVGFEPAKKKLFKSHKEPSKKITRQSVVKLNCTYREQFGKYPLQVFLKSKILCLCCYSFDCSWKFRVQISPKIKNFILPAFSDIIRQKIRVMLQPTLLQGVESVLRLCLDTSLVMAWSTPLLKQTSLGQPLSFIGWKRDEFDSQLSSLRRETHLKMPFPYKFIKTKGSWLLCLMLNRVFKKRN